MGRGGWLIALLAGCGPSVADVGVDGDGGSGEHGDHGEATSTSTDADVTSGDPPDACVPTGTCEGDCALWDTEYRGSRLAFDGFNAVAVAPDGTILAGGMRDQQQRLGTADAVVVAYDPDGALLWESTPLGTDDDAEDWVSTLAIADDGRIAVGCVSVVDSQYFRMLALLAADGTLEQLVELGSGSMGATLFAPDGSLIVVGAGGDLGAWEGAVLRYAADGALADEWDGDALGLSSGVIVAAVATSPTTIALVGASYPDDAVWLASLDFADGVRWVQRYDDSPTLQWAHDIAALPDGDLVVVGEDVYGDDDGLAWVARFGADGSQRWTRAYPGTDCCPKMLSQVEITPEGRIFVLGNAGRHDARLELQELDCNGDVAWTWNQASVLDGITPGGLRWSPEIGLVSSYGQYLPELTGARGMVVRMAL